MSVTTRLPRTSPASVGVDAGAMDALVKKLDELGGAHSVMVLRHGAVLGEAWWAPYSPERTHLMFSVSKTFTAMAVGLAVEDGLLDVGDRVVDLLPDDVPADADERLGRLTVEHLLTMTVGQQEREFDQENWATEAMSRPFVHEPGERFAYDSLATYLLSAIVQRLTGCRVLDLLTERVLTPLGIEGAYWEQCPRGIDTGGWGLELTTEDMAVFGQLLLQRGEWEGRRLLPAAWIDRAMSNLSDSEVQKWSPDSRLGYGYQMWQCRDGAARADGAFGQFIVVWPQHDLVVAATSGTTDMQSILDAVWSTIGEGIVDDGAPAFLDGAAWTRDDLIRPLPAGAASSDVERLVGGVTYTLDVTKGEAPTRNLTVRREGDTLVVDGPVFTARAAHGEWLPGTAPRLAEHDQRGDQPVASAYAWIDERTLELRVIAVETPFDWTFVLRFDDVAAEPGRPPALTFTIDQNVDFGDTALLRATGHPA